MKLRKKFLKNFRIEQIEQAKTVGTQRQSQEECL